MNTITEHGTFEDVIAAANPDIGNLATHLRSLISEVFPDVYEVPWPKQKIAGYGVGPKKQTEHFCYLGMFKKHVNLGFNHGSEIEDPDGLLEGTGKKYRHLKIGAIEDVEKPAVRLLLESAVTERKRELGK